MSKDDDSVSNPSANTHFSEVLEVSMRRRRLLQGGLGATALAFFGAPALTAMSEAVAKTLPAPAVPTFTPIAAAFVDDVRVPPGYTAQVLYSWGDPTGIRRNMPEFHAVNGVSANTAEEQAFQAGMDHDGMHFFAFGDGEGDKDDDRRGTRGGLLCMNHENIQPEFLLGVSTVPAQPSAEQVQKMKNAHGTSVIEDRKSVV